MFRGYKPILLASVFRRWLSLSFKPFRLHHCIFPCAASSSSVVARSLPLAFLWQATLAKHSLRGRRSQFPAYILPISPSISLPLFMFDPQLRLLPPRGSFAIAPLAMTLSFISDSVFYHWLYFFFVNDFVFLINIILGVTHRLPLAKRVVFCFGRPVLNSLKR